MLIATTTTPAETTKYPCLRQKDGNVYIMIKATEGVLIASDRQDRIGNKVSGLFHADDNYWDKINSITLTYRG